MKEQLEVLPSKTKGLKIAMNWCKNRWTDQWNKIENTDINSYTYGHLILDKEAKNTHWGNDIIVNKWCWSN